MSQIPLPVAWVAQDSGNVNQISRVKAAGFRSAALSLAFTNQTAVQAFRDAGIFVVVEGVVGPSTTLPAGAQAFCANIESTSQLDGAIAALDAGLGKGLPLAVGITYGGLDTPDGSAWKRLSKYPIERAFVECYKADDPSHADIVRMLSQGVVYGIPKDILIALCGTYRSEVPADYPGLTKDNYGGIFHISQTNDDQLSQWKRINSQVPISVAIPNPSNVNQSVNDLTHTWLDPYLPDTKDSSRLRIEERISRNGINPTAAMNTAWNKAAPELKAVLDKYGIST